MGKLMIMMVVVVVIIGTTTISTAEAQSTLTCALKLAPCLDYMKSTTTPPDSCCNPLKEAVAKELDCLCNLYKNPDLLKSFNVSVSDALRLTKNCGVTVNLSACNASAGPAQSPASVPPSPEVHGNDSRGAGRIAFSTGINSLLLFWAILMLS